MTTNTQPPLPLFYQAPELLSSTVHGAWRLREGNCDFARATPFVPIVASEIAAASSAYPVVFAKDDAQPIAVTGIEQANLFIEDGRWDEDVYVPAYVRRYPFGFFATVNPDGFALAIDTLSDRIVRDGEEGAPLFENDAPTDLARQALGFCDAFQRDAEATRAFIDSVRAQDLLVDQRADVTLPDGVQRGIEGFQIIDAERFAKLADEVVVDWHRRGWLAFVHFHLASLARFQALLERRAKRATVAKMSHGDALAADLVDQLSPESEKA